LLITSQQRLPLASPKIYIAAVANLVQRSFQASQVAVTPSAWRLHYSPAIEIQNVYAICRINLDVVGTKVCMKDSRCMETPNATSNRVP
jgi:hypothetical protein